ncbi:MAG: sensor domain-containing diguanylate cyclase [bacterium]|nr:sensor domain-containing diguanylate cyclase [bacterium]
MIKKKIKEVINKNVNEGEISKKANELPDKNLFQAAVLNEISYLNRNIYDLENILQSILNLLQGIIKFEIGVIFLAEEKIMLIFSREKQSNENNEKAINTAINNFNQLAGQRISKNEMKIKVIDSGNISTNSNQSINSFIFSEIYAKNNIMGILMIGCYQENAYSDIDSKSLNSFVTHASIVMDNARLYQKLESLTVIDELTKIYNKRYLAQIIPQELSRVERYRRTLSIIMFDIDFFKKVNDAYGCIQGDIILKEVVKIARVTLRKVDILIRYGGEEFIILLPEVNLEIAQNIAERIRKAVEVFSFSGQKEPLRITISLGVTTCTKELIDEGGKKLISVANEALYEAKKSGRNRVCVAKK